MVLEEVLGEVLDFWKGVVMVPGYDGVGAIPSFWERAWMAVEFRRFSTSGRAPISSSTSGGREEG